MTHNMFDIKECTKACWNCRHECQTTLFTHCLKMGGIHVEENHVKLMSDCIDICQIAADFMTRQSPHHAIICAACAEICEDCAQSCAKIGGEVMDMCAKACRECAESCRNMAKYERRAA